MIALRLVVLTLAAALVAVALGVTGSDLQPSARRVLITSVVGVLAPLFWPGSAATPARTAVRIMAWSFAAALIAAVVLIAGFPASAVVPIAKTCAVLFVILLVVHAVAAGLEGFQGEAGRTVANEMSGPVAALALATLGASPLILGPFGELLAAGHPWVIDAVVGVSPLTHLAVTSGNDLLRNQWFYQHSNLAALQYDYPRVATFTAFYTAVGVALVLVPLALRGASRPSDDAPPTHPTTEHAK